MFFSGFPKIIGMENFPSLQSLTLMGQQITMLENLECLPNLTELCVSESKLSVSQFLYDTVHCMHPPPFFMGWVFSILVMCSWDSITVALCSMLYSCTVVTLSKARSQKNKVQICYINMYLRRIILNSVVFSVLLWILQDFADLLEFRGSITTQNIRSPENSLQRCN